MPRIVPIVSPDVPHVSLFLGAALARTPDFRLLRTPDSSLLRFIDGEHPRLTALDVPRPFMVMDPREAARIVGPTVPEDWSPTVLTRCMLPVGRTYDMWVGVVGDVARMAEGFAVERGKKVALPEPWPWSLDEEGKWTPEPRWRQMLVDDYYRRTGQDYPADAERPAPTEPGAASGGAGRVSDV